MRMFEAYFRQTLVCGQQPGEDDQQACDDDQPPQALALLLQPGQFLIDVLSVSAHGRYDIRPMPKKQGPPDGGPVE